MVKLSVTFWPPVPVRVKPLMRKDSSTTAGVAAKSRKVLSVRSGAAVAQFRHCLTTRK